MAVTLAGMSELRKVSAFELARAIAEHHHQGIVDLEQTPITKTSGLAYGRLLKLHALNRSRTSRPCRSLAIADSARMPNRPLSRGPASALPRRCRAPAPSGCPRIRGASGRALATRQSRMCSLAASSKHRQWLNPRSQNRELRSPLSEQHSALARRDQRLLPCPYSLAKTVNASP